MIDKNLWKRKLDLSIFELAHNDEEDEQKRILSLMATEYQRVLYNFSKDIFPFDAIFSINHDGFEYLREFT